MAMMDARNGNPGAVVRLNHVSDYDVGEYDQAEHGECKSDDAGELQRQCAESGHHVHRVADQLLDRVVGLANGPWIVAHRYCGEARCAPREEDVDGHVRPHVILEASADVRAEYSKRADLSRCFGSDRSLKSNFGYLGREVAKRAVLLDFRFAVNHIEAFVVLLQKLHNFFRRVLQVVVDGDNNVAFRLAGMPASSALCWP